MFSVRIEDTRTFQARARDLLSKAIKNVENNRPFLTIIEYLCRPTPRRYRLVSWADKTVFVPAKLPVVSDAFRPIRLTLIERPQNINFDSS